MADRLDQVVVHEEEGEGPQRDEGDRLQHLADADEEDPDVARESLAHPLILRSVAPLRGVRRSARPYSHPSASRGRRSRPHDE